VGLGLEPGQKEDTEMDEGTTDRPGSESEEQLQPAPIAGTLAVKLTLRGTSAPPRLDDVRVALLGLDLGGDLVVKVTDIAWTDR
jgi:hypothetical protein